VRPEEVSSLHSTVGLSFIREERKENAFGVWSLERTVAHTWPLSVVQHVGFWYIEIIRFRIFSLRCVPTRFFSRSPGTGGY
jgi:hypothetical protein